MFANWKAKKGKRTWILRNNVVTVKEVKEVK